MLHTAKFSSTSSNGANSTSDSEPHPQPPSSQKLIFAPGVSEPSPSTSNHQPPRAAQFQIGSLHLSSLDPDSPFTQFHKWYSSPELSSSVPETCTLSTASLPSGRVSARMVYLKELDSRGFVIYSNWATSQKARDYESNKWCALTFWWKGMERQVRVEGKGERLTREESQVYFDTRARGSRIGAWASRQSQVLIPKHTPTSTSTPKDTAEPKNPEPEDTEQEEEDDGRHQLLSWVQSEEERWSGQSEIDVPEHWGGLRIIPEMVEFWQGRESRLHDRFRYVKKEEEEGAWKIERLSP